MSAITAHRAGARTTPLERTLLRAASALDSFVEGRLARRTAVEHRRTIALQDDAARARRTAEALGALGMPPR